MTDQEYTGGSVSYYTCSVTHPISESADPYDAECIDIIDALQMTPNEANAFKALWRRAAARLGKSKRGYTDGLYDAEKVEFYGKRLVELERRGKEPIRVNCSECGEPWLDLHVCSIPVRAVGPDPMPATPAPWPWQEHPKGACAPVEFDVEVEVTFADGSTSKGSACHYIWTTGTTSRITHWRLPVPLKPASDPFGPRDTYGWYTWNGDDTMRPAGMVDIIDKDGEWSKGSMDAGTLRWAHTGEAGDIVKWRPAQNSTGPRQCAAGSGHSDCWHSALPGSKYCREHQRT